jgi:ketosteroid isomerase-like protein
MTVTAEATLQDRIAITDVLTRYSTCIDEFDFAGVRSTLADDVEAQYANLPPVTGGDALVAWIEEATATVIWQHHQLGLQRFELDGDTARTVSYLTSHQLFSDDPDAAKVLVARYHDELRREPDGWRIAKRTMELLWGESHPDNGYLAAVGGRGPKLWARD